MPSETHAPVMNRAKRLNQGLTLITLLLPVYWVASEVGYAHRKSPEGIATVEDFTHRFGAPRLIREIRREGATFYELTGPRPSWPWLFAFPSSPPAYVFDQRGRFVLWCSDPGEGSDYTATWPRHATRELSPEVLRTEIGAARGSP